MKQVSTILLLTLLVVAGIGFSKPKKPTKLAFPIPKGWPKPTYNFANNPLTVEGFELGKKLFYDEKLSIDSTISCASCHQQFAAFSTFDHDLSHGVHNTFTNRNAPALQNLAWRSDFMVDGGILHLDFQPLAPLTAPNEMGETIAHLVQKLQADNHYKAMFKAAFGTEEVNTKRITQALSQYMLLLISSNSKYDRVMQGKDSFNLPQQLGYTIFNQNCVSCHPPPFFTDHSFRNIGLPQDKFLTDLGRMTITNQTADSLKFRVPSLRNVEVTAPYGHDGRFFSVFNVFEHYRKQVKAIPQTDSIFKKGFPLSNFEIGQLTAFLYTLTDTSFLRNPRFAPANYHAPPPVHVH